MSVNINSNTVIRLIVRRGTDLERQYATLDTGELAYAIDTKRLFIGNGTVGDSTVAGNKLIGVVTYLSEVSQAQPGDTVFETSTQKLWALQDPASLGWITVGTNIIFDDLPGTGLSYFTESSASGNVQQSVNKLELDSAYWAMSAGNVFIGNIYNNWTSVTPAKLAVGGPLFINGEANTSQIQLSASNSCSVNFRNVGGTGYTTFSTQSAFRFTTTTSTGTSANPGFVFTGGKTNGAVLVEGNLYVKGAATFLSGYNAISTTAMSLTSLNIDTTGHPALTALVLYNGDPSPVTLIDVSGINGPILTVNTQPWFGVNTNNFKGLSAYNIALSGRTILTNGCTVVGDISATGDVVAYYSSDSRLKDNIVPITSALDKLMSLRGVEFDWNSKSIYNGHDIGVIAQEVEKVIPSAVADRQNGYKGVQYEKIIPLIIEAIRELNDKK